MDRILVVGATGHIGKHIATASAQLGHQTFALIRPNTLEDPAKADILDFLTEAGVTFLKGSLQDSHSLIQAVNAVDVVISAVGKAEIIGQLKLVEAISQVGHHIKRFLPSEFGSDIRRVHLLPPTRAMYAKKIQIQDAVMAARIPYTILSSNCFAGIWLEGFSSSPQGKSELVYGHAKAYFVAESDIGAYAVKAAVDPRAANKVVYIRPEKNLFSHGELLELWERKSGRHLAKTQLESDQVVKKVEETPFPQSVVVAIAYSLFVKGDTTNFDVPSDALEATMLYPDTQYLTMDKYAESVLQVP